jgi:hypothetical protein
MMAGPVRRRLLNLLTALSLLMCVGIVTPPVGGASAVDGRTLRR